MVLREMRNYMSRIAIVALLVIFYAGGAANSEPLVVSTTSIVDDVVRQVAGDRGELVVLVPRGTDPHSFEPQPRDARYLAQADVVFAVGAGLEETLEALFAATEARVIELAPHVPLLRWGTHQEQNHNHHDPHESHNHGAYDPHVWLDPANVIRWTQVLEEELAKLDPAGAEHYAAHAARYREELRELNAWVEEQLSALPPERRLLVTDHAVLGYFANRYEFVEVGAVIPSLTTLAEPSPKELARLVDTVHELGVPAVFVSSSVNPALAQALAREADIETVRLYTESLSDDTGPAPSYIELMRHNVRAIVEALEGR